MKQNDIASIRRAIESLAGNNHLRRYAAPLQSRIVALVRAHPEIGMTSMARSLDMAPQTLERIVSKGRSSLVPVRITAKPAQSSAFAVRGPSGIVIEGLDLRGLAELIRALS